MAVCSPSSLADALAPFPVPNAPQAGAAGPCPSPDAPPSPRHTPLRGPAPAALSRRNHRVRPERPAHPRS